MHLRSRSGDLAVGVVGHFRIPGCSGRSALTPRRQGGLDGGAGEHVRRHQSWQSGGTGFFRAPVVRKNATGGSVQLDRHPSSWRVHLCRHVDPIPHETSSLPRSSRPARALTASMGSRGAIGSSLEVLSPARLPDSGGDRSPGRRAYRLQDARSSRHRPFSL